MSSQSTQDDFRPLLNCADELLLGIIEFIGQDLPTLRALALACKRLQVLTEPYIYTNLFVHNGMEAVKLTAAFHTRPARAVGVRNLIVKSKAGDEQGLKWLDPLCDSFVNLKTWEIESPCPNDGPDSRFSGGVLTYWLHVNRFEFLQSISLHTHVTSCARDPNFFDLDGGKGAVLFAKQSLRHIRIACSNITEYTVRSLLQCESHTTNLECLEFEECNVDAKALKTVLTMPKALKRLTLGERLFHRIQSPSLFEAGDLVAEALEPQAQHLEYLKHTEQGRGPIDYLIYIGIGVPGYVTVQSPIPRKQKLPECPKLREIDIVYESCLRMLSTKFESRIQKLRIHGVPYAMLSADVLLDGLPNDYNHFQHPELRHLELVLREYRTDRDDTEEQWAREMLYEDSAGNPWSCPDYRDNVWLLAYRLKKRGVRLTVNAVRSAGFIPPYMHGEIKPYEFNIYDSDRMDVFGSVAMGRWFSSPPPLDRLRAEENTEDGDEDNDDDYDDDDYDDDDDDDNDEHGDNHAGSDAMETS